MTITVQTQNTTITGPVDATLSDRSGAHVVLTLVAGGQALVSHAFSDTQGELQVPLDLPSGTYKCTFVVQAFEHKAVNKRYQCGLALNGKAAASAKGTIPKSRTNDIGFGDFTLVVQ